MISYYNNIRETNSQKTIDIETFVFSVGHKKEWEQIIDKFRKNEIEKTSLPAVTISGEFKERKTDGLIAHSGFIAFDFDDQDASILINDPYSFAVFKSCSGNGYCCIVKVDPKKHSESWKALANYYRDNFKLHADQSCKDITRARFISYDPHIKINIDSKKWTKAHKTKPLPKTEIIHIKSNFDFVLEQIQNEGIDITSDYNDWVRVGLSIYSEFGSSGLDYFHIISQNHPDYNYKKTESKYKSFKGASKISIATFYHIAKSHGLNLISNRTNEIKKIANTVKKNGGDKEELKKELNKYNITPDPVELDLLDSPYEKPNNIDEKNHIALARHYLETQHNLWKCEVRQKFYDGSREVNDEFIASIWEDLNLIGIKLNKTNLTDLILSSKTIVKDPLREYFRSISNKTNKGETHLIDRWISCIPFRYPEEARKLIYYFFMGTMETLYNKPTPYCLVLTGEQGGTGKTVTLRDLIPNEINDFFAEINMDGGKDDDRVMTQNLIVFNDEFDGQTIKQSARFKAQLSKDKFTMRLPYARHIATFKRIASIVGTSNEEKIIFDKSTNNRRIFPLEVIDTINFDEVNAINKADLWSQVYNLWDSKSHPVQMTKEDMNMLQELSTGYQSKTWLDTFIEDFTEPDENNFMKLGEIIMEIKSNFRTDIDESNLGKALKTAGIKKVRKVLNGKQQYFYQLRILRNANGLY